jgi:hypothetical protein
MDLRDDEIQSIAQAYFFKLQKAITEDRVLAQPNSLEEAYGMVLGILQYVIIGACAISFGRDFRLDNVPELAVRIVEYIADYGEKVGPSDVSKN